MVNIETSVVINKPVEEVFEFVDDTSNDVQWQDGVLESKQTPEGPVGVGTKVSNTIQLLGKRIESTFEVTEHVPNRRVRYKALSGPIPFDALTTFEGVEGGTRVNIEVEADVGGVFKLAEPIVARTSQRQWENSFATLKDILEADG